MKYNILLLLFLIPACHSTTEPETSALTDIDGNVYRTVKIGAQWWMAENLKVTRYSNGDDVPNISDDGEWSELTSGAWVYYGNNPVVNDDYGKLYNWYAANDERDICPGGWKVPSESDLNLLIDQLGGRTVAGGALKDTTFWISPNEGATNETGFTARPGGFRHQNGTFDFIGRVGYLWSQGDASRVYDMHYLRASIGSQVINKRWGFSIRCVRE